LKSIEKEEDPACWHIGKKVVTLGGNLNHLIEKISNGNYKNILLSEFYE
jgi:hypothetical protein